MLNHLTAIRNYIHCFIPGLAVLLAVDQLFDVITSFVFYTFYLFVFVFCFGFFELLNKYFHFAIIYAIFSLLNLRDKRWTGKINTSV